jgi:hypothetical protein
MLDKKIIPGRTPFTHLPFKLINPKNMATEHNNPHRTILIISPKAV